jgi:hypothetical protein
MRNKLRWDGEDRRELPRVAGEGRLKAAVVDEFGQTREVLRHAQVVNVSGGGLAFTSEVSASVGATVSIRTPGLAGDPFRVRIVGSSQRGDGHCELRAQLVDGAIPACLMYDW